MTTHTTLLGVLKKARDLISAGDCPGVIDAISSLRGETTGRLRDLAYYALLETVMMDKGVASISVLSSPESQDATVELFDTTIRRITSTLH
jgi:hypothetical protein